MKGAARFYFRRLFRSIYTVIPFIIASFRSIQRKFPGRVLCTPSKILSIVAFTALSSLLLTAFIFHATNILLPPRNWNQPLLPYGLSLVDTKGHVGPISAEFVIFVHGLGSFPDSTWRKRDTSALNKEERIEAGKASWIRDFLPDDLKSARLLFYNYDSTTYNNAQQLMLRDYGQGLLDAMETSDTRTSMLERNRPVIFLCHSYGGLVVKQALVAASRNKERYDDLLRNFAGAVFLGTPHKGCRYSGVGRILAQFLRLSASNPDLFLELKTNSTELRELHQSFIENFGNASMINFYETRKTRVLSFPPISTLFIESSLATFDAPNTKQYMINTDHSGLNKFNSRTDHSYKQVLHALGTMIDKAVKEKHNVPALFQEKSSEQPLGPRRRPRCCHVRPQTVPNFVNRTTLSARIASTLNDISKFTDPPRAVALFGLGGSGKSQLALQYLQSNKDRFNPVLWLDAQTPETLRTSYWEAFEELGLEQPSGVMDQLRKGRFTKTLGLIPLAEDLYIKQVMRWLETREETDEEWLVVLDNANDINLAREYMPRGQKGTLLVTSRDLEIRNLVESVIHVGDLSTDEALDVLLRKKYSHQTPDIIHPAKSPSQLSEYNAAVQIVEELGHLALAVDLAGAYIAYYDGLRENISLYLHEYLAISADASLRWPSVKRDGYENTISSVWETSFEAVTRVNPTSAELLLLLSVLDRTGIEDQLFRSATLGNSQRTATGIGILEFFILAFLPPTALRMGLLKWGQEWRIKHQISNSIMHFIRLILALVGITTIFWTTEFQEHQSDRRARVDPGTLSSESKDYTTSPYVALGTGLTLSVTLLVDWLCSISGWPYYLGKNYSPTPKNSCKNHDAASPSLAEARRPVLDTKLLPNPSESFSPAFAGRELANFDEVILRIALKIALQFVSVFCMMVVFIYSTYIIALASDRYRDQMRKENWEAANELLQHLAFSDKNLAAFSSLNSKISVDAYASLVQPQHFTVLATITSMCFGLTTGFAGVAIDLYLLRLFHLTLSGHPWSRVRCVPSLKTVCLIIGAQVCLCLGFVIVSSVFKALNEYSEHLSSPYTTSVVLVAESLMTSTRDGRWDARPYLQAASLLSRFSFLQRTRSGGYIMHPMVRMWARARQNESEIMARIQVALDILLPTVHDRGMWADASFQNRLIRHVLELLASCAQRVTCYTGPLNSLIKLLHAALRRMELIAQIENDRP